MIIGSILTFSYFSKIKTNLNKLGMKKCIATKCSPPLREAVKASLNL